MNIDRMDNGRTEVGFLKAGDVFLLQNNYYIVVSDKESECESECKSAYFNLYDGTRLYIPNKTRVIHCPIAIIYPWGRK